MMHIFSMKGKTKMQAIQDVPDAPLLYLPLSQCVGLPAVPVVDMGQRVLKYQLVARASSYMSSNIHAPVSGVVRAIEKHPWANGGMVDTIILENDFKDEEVSREIVDVDSFSPEEILNIIGQSGIVGEGGAEFPTYVKYDIKGWKIDTFIINGTECEPYITSDYALMKEKTGRLFYSMLIVNRILRADEIVISIEEQNKDLLPVFEPFLEREEFGHVRVAVLPNEYPQGGELQLIKSVTGKVLPKGILPKEIGVIVSNVGTMNAIHEAVVRKKTVIERVITISGEKSRNYGNFNVKIGTPISHILETQGLTDMGDDCTLVLGGPMMGRNVTDTSVPVTKGLSGVLLLQKKKIKRNNCISCGYCADVCPMHLMPMKFDESFRLGKFRRLEKQNIGACIECAACEYICPANVPLIQSIKEGKQKLKTILSSAT